jgi:hypothetical protein
MLFWIMLFWILLFWILMFCILIFQILLFCILIFWIINLDYDVLDSDVLDDYKNWLTHTHTYVEYFITLFKYNASMIEVPIFAKDVSVVYRSTAAGSDPRVPL